MLEHDCAPLNTNQHIRERTYTLSTHTNTLTQASILLVLPDFMNLSAMRAKRRAFSAQQLAY